MAQFNKDGFNAKFMSECAGKQHCHISFQFYEFARLPPEQQRLNMVLFAQVSCTQTEETILSKNLWGLATACIGLFMCFIFWSTIHYLLRTDKIKERIHDLNLVTVDDYTAQARLPDGLYQDFLKDQGSELGEDDVPIMRFQEKMIETI